MIEPNLYNVGYDVGFEDGFKEAQARVLDDVGDDPEIMAATRAEWAARAKTAEAKLAKAEWLLVDATVQLEEGKIKTRRNRAALIRQFLAELTGGNDE